MQFIDRIINCTRDICAQVNILSRLKNTGWVRPPHLFTFEHRTPRQQRAIESGTWWHYKAVLTVEEEHS